jgi:hypothetical protein
MKRITRLAAGLAAFVTLSASAPAAAQQRSCFWTLADDPNVVNIAYPDEGANYWSATLSMPPGGEVVLRGRYPHARYMSFVAYDAAERPIDGIGDVEIRPDPGSANPFLRGAARDSGKRAFTLHVMGDPAPTDRAARKPNTLYLGQAGQTALGGTIIYRVYVPDRGLDETGGVGLPVPGVRTAGGTETPYPGDCTALDGIHTSSSINEGFATSEAMPASSDKLAHDPLQWHVFFNTLYALGSAWEEAYGVPNQMPSDRQGGFYSNVDTTYATASGSRSIGPVLVVRGRAPSSPRTEAGERRMGGGQVRYWSLCENERYTQRFIDCAHDEQIPLTRHRRFTVVVSQPSQRPANARAECGVTWLRWGGQSEALLILRHMLPSPRFVHALRRVERPGDELRVVGDYLPEGRHMARASFEQNGCRGW